ncbi:MAG: (d)CMP kinase [Gemmataceae bacterium]
MIITIDGPAKSGKSRAAELLAFRIGFQLLNTGAMYRATALALKERGFHLDAGDPRYAKGIADFIEDFHFEMFDGVFLNGRDFTQLVLTPEAGNLASVVGVVPEVREKLKREQRRIADSRDVICEGRDQGTSVFPHAEIKFFITASPEARAERMAKTMTGTPDLSVLAREIAERDHRDSTRKLDPLKPATDAIIIDTSNQTAEEVVDIMHGVVSQWRSKG